MPETLPPTVPSKSFKFKATPYSVMDVPRTGMVNVELAHACKAGVALAMIRSTFLFTKELAIVTHVAESPAAS